MGIVARGPAEDICRDPAVVAAYIADPLVYQGKITARLGAEMLGAMEHLRREAGRISLPLLILQGSADRLVDPAGAQILYDGVASPDKRLIVYEGFYHEVFNEPEHDRVLERRRAVAGGTSRPGEDDSRPGVKPPARRAGFRR